MWLGVVEKKKHSRRLKKIPIRININGIRGKSTITRLIYSILREDQYKVIGKTTGTDARMLYWFTSREYPVYRKPQGANIGEQRDIVRKVVKQRANALVNECMAVNPDYQITFQGHLIVMKDEYTSYFAKVAKRRKTKLIVVDKDKVPEQYLRKFDYLVFPDNVAIALGVAEALGIDNEIALQGMLNAPPDSGAVEIKYFNANNTTNVYVNAFAANETKSSKAILNKVESYNYPYKKKIIILNCRADRGDRKKMFAEDFIEDVDFDTLICTGKSTQMVTEVMKRNPNKKYLNFENSDIREIEDSVYAECKNALVFCVGNIHGPGKKIAQFIEGIN